MLQSHDLGHQTVAHTVPLVCCNAASSQPHCDVDWHVSRVSAAALSFVQFTIKISMSDQL